MYDITRLLLATTYLFVCDFRKIDKMYWIFIKKTSILSLNLLKKGEENQWNESIKMISFLNECFLIF